MSPGQYRVWVRDVPMSCHCQWVYRVTPARWVRARYITGCPWHGR